MVGWQEWYPVCIKSSCFHLQRFDLGKGGWGGRKVEPASLGKRSLNGSSCYSSSSSSNSRQWCTPVAEWLIVCFIQKFSGTVLLLLCKCHCYYWPFQYCFAGWPLLSLSVVVCNAAGRQAGRQAHVRSAAAWAVWRPTLHGGQYGNVPLGRHLLSDILSVYFRSTLNRVDLIKPVSDVHPYVRLFPETFFDFVEIWHVGRGRWVMYDGMTRSKVKSRSRALQSWKYGRFQKLSSPPMRDGNWRLILKLRHNI